MSEKLPLIQLADDSDLLRRAAFYIAQDVHDEERPKCVRGLFTADQMFWLADQDEQRDTLRAILERVGRDA